MSILRIEIAEVGEGNEVEMGMVRNAEAFDAIPDTDAVRGLLKGRADDILGHEEEMGIECVIEVYDMADFFFRHDEEMSELDRMDIEKGEEMLVLVDTIGGDFSGDDAAEEGRHTFIVGKELFSQGSSL